MRVMSVRIRPVATRASAIALVAVAAFALSSCEKPSPGVSVVSGTTSAYREAVCWSFDGAPLSPDTCSADAVSEALAGGTVARIPVVPGDTIGISVDPKVADVGWYPVVGSQRLTQAPVFTTYYRFTYPDLQPVPPTGVVLQVVAGQGESTQGIWIFQLVPSGGVAPEPSPSESPSPAPTASGSVS